ncbi:MAG TPA: F0F1 ATP synthase subunit A [Polyangia bacterium]|nr:F0F1 ATP synthase subunit A [Polyangia bacterium]
MSPHATWFDFLPGYPALKEYLHPSMVRTWNWQVFQTTNFDLVHVMGALLVFLFVAFGAYRYAVAVSGSGDAGLVPPPKFGLRNLFEVLADTVLGLMAGVMGEKAAKRYLPLVGTLFIFILFSNLLGLIPGFLPPTETLKTNLALSLSVFVLSHAFGVREHGLKYFKHFLGPIWWLIPLMLPIELISHIARPVSLSMRLMGNIVGDHKLVGVFFGILPFLLPVPFMVMGVLVCVVQAVVFSLLTTVYISQAVAHEEH